MILARMHPLQMRALRSRHAISSRSVVDKPDTYLVGFMVIKVEEAAPKDDQGFEKQDGSV
jgi:hypothetical protein